MARRARPGTRALRLVMLMVAGLALVARRRGPTTRFQAVLDPVEDSPATLRPVAQARVAQPAARRPVRRRRTVGRPRRLIGTFAVAVCFFAGAALSAGAGDRAVLLLDDVASEEALPLETTETTETAGEPPADGELLPPTEVSSAAEAAAAVPAPAPAAPGQ